MANDQGTVGLFQPFYAEAWVAFGFSITAGPTVALAAEAWSKLIGANLAQMKISPRG